MQNKTATSFIVAFVLAALVITVAAAGNYSFYNIVKPVLMPLLIATMVTAAQKKAGHALITTGLFFSWAGDVLLMYENKNAFFFIGGLVCFLITHIFYIVYFLKLKPGHNSLIQKQPWLAVLVAAYGTGLVLFLWPYLGDMKIPVLLYAIVICTMVVCSLHIFFRVTKNMAQLFISGAILFALSDSLLAVNKFYHPFLYAGAYIIATYCAAQLLIVCGAVKKL